MKEYFGLGSIAIPLVRRAEGQKLRWSDLGGMHNQEIWATKDYYKPVEVYQHNDKEDLGIELVLAQTFPTDDAREYHLNQDLVFALGLKREGDVWVKPDEDYIEVVRLRRNADGSPAAIEIKNEFLRDYLAARQMYLRTSLYRERSVAVEEPKDAGPPDVANERTDTERYEVRVQPMKEGGHFGDASFAFFHVSRTDVDPDEDVPVPGPETDENTASKSWTGKREGRALTYIDAELWRDERYRARRHQCAGPRRQRTSTNGAAIHHRRVRQSGNQRRTGRPGQFAVAVVSLGSGSGNRWSPERKFQMVHQGHGRRRAGRKRPDTFRHQ